MRQNLNILLSMYRRCGPQWVWGFGPPNLVFHPSPVGSRTRNTIQWRNSGRFVNLNSVPLRQTDMEPKKGLPHKHIYRSSFSGGFRSLNPLSCTVLVILPAEAASDRPSHQVIYILQDTCKTPFRKGNTAKPRFLCPVSIWIGTHPARL